MGVGMSGASIFVVKTGPDLARQFHHMCLLGREVCPEVFHLLPEGMSGYAMELCEQFSGDEADDLLIHQMVELLEDHVWGAEHEPMHRALYELLPAWISENCPWLLSDYQSLYGDPGKPQDWCLIHGDPTVANVIFRGDKLLISDALPPGGKIPSLREVDEGKILQSCRGYESAIDYISPRDVYDLNPPESIVDEKSWFWSCVHMARVVPYARNRGRQDLADWCLEQSRHTDVEFP